MKCENCGTELENDQTVCPTCGPQEQETQEQKTVRKTLKQRKKEKIRKIVLSVVAGLLAVALVVSLLLIGVNDGWGKENDIYKKVSYGSAEWVANLNRGNVVAKAGDFTLTNGHLQILYSMQVLDYLSQFGSYVSYSGIDITKPLSEQVYDKVTGLTWEKYFLQNALAAWLEACAVTAQAEKADYQMPQEFTDHFANLRETMQKAAEEDGYASIDAMLQHDLGENVRYDDYYNYLYLYYASNLYLSEVMGKMEFLDAEIENYFKDNEEDLKTNYGVTKDSGDYVDVRHILVMPEGGTKSEDGNTTTYSEAEWEACRVKAQAIYDEWLAGDKTEDSFGALANEKSQDKEGEVTDGGIYTNVKKGQMVTAFNDWCFDETRESGDHGLVKTEHGYHVMYFVDRDPIWYRYCLSGLQYNETENLIATYVDSLPFDVYFGKIVLDNIELSGS